MAVRRVFQAKDLAFLTEQGPGRRYKFDLPPSAIAALSDGEATRQAWSIPARPLPIDRVVAELIDRKDVLGRPLSPRISVTSTGGKCPFKEARAWIDLAVGNANMALDLSSRQRAEREEIRRRLSEVTAAREALGAIAFWDAYAVDIGNLSVTPSLRDEDASNARAEAFSNAHDGVIKVLADLSVLFEALQSRNVEIPQRLRSPHLAWRDQFIEHLGIGWHAITGASPGYGIRFTEFVSSSFETIGGDTEIEWERAVREVLQTVNARPENMRFDRFARPRQTKPENISALRRRDDPLISVNDLKVEDRRDLLKFFEYYAQEIGRSYLDRLSAAIGDEGIATRLRQNRRRRPQE